MVLHSPPKRPMMPTRSARACSLVLLAWWWQFTCVESGCVTIHMADTYGDGWNDAMWTINADGVENTGTLR